MVVKVSFQKRLAICKACNNNKNTEILAEKILSGHKVLVNYYRNQSNTDHTDPVLTFPRLWYLYFYNLGNLKYTF